MITHGCHFPLIQEVCGVVFPPFPLSVKSLGEVMGDLQLDTFSDYAKRVGLWRTLDVNVWEEYTVFVPSDDAFSSKRTDKVKPIWSLATPPPSKLR